MYQLLRRGQFRLLAAQGFERVQMRRPPRRQHAGGQPNGEGDQFRQHGVGPWRMHRQRRQHDMQRERRPPPQQQSDRAAQRRQQRRLAQKQQQDALPRRADGAQQTDLGRALGYGNGKYGEYADAFFFNERAPPGIYTLSQRVDLRP